MNGGWGTTAGVDVAVSSTPGTGSIDGSFSSVLAVAVFVSDLDLLFFLCFFDFDRRGFLSCTA